MGIVDADIETTWPTPLLEALSARASEIAAFQRERARVDHAAEEDVALRVQRPHNPHQGTWDSILGMASQSLGGCRVLGFHATRLTPEEIVDIKQGGMEVLTDDLLSHRLSAAQTSGAMRQSMAEILRGANMANHSNRSGRTHFCFSRDLLGNEMGMRRLFQFWGGEALYGEYEDHPQFGPALRGIGVPCIIAATIPVEDIRTYLDVSERLVNVWCAKRGINTGHEAHFQGNTLKNTVPDNIMRIIEFSDPEFLSLTSHHLWRKPLT
jgi:hypothetical protein